MQVVEGAMGGVELLLTGRADDLRAQLAQAELKYTRIPGYDGTDAIQVLLCIFCVIVQGLCWRCLFTSACMIKCLGECCTFSDI